MICPQLPCEGAKLEIDWLAKSKRCALEATMELEAMFCVRIQSACLTSGGHCLNPWTYLTVMIRWTCS
jgi:hypothetical protein